MPAFAADQDLFDRSADSVRELDAGRIRQILHADGGRYRWPRFRGNEVELEWRRWRIRHSLGAADDPPASILLFEKLAVAEGLPAAALLPEVGSATVAPLSQTYDDMFPQGPLVTKALQHRVVRPAPAQRPEEDHTRLLAESTRRRSGYLAKLDEVAFWWNIGDLVSAATLTRCAREARALRPSPAMAFSGGPEPGWDVLHDALTSRSSTMYLGAGPTLVGIHEDPALVRDVSVRMGRQMYPTRCTYLRYRPEDYLGVHTDMPTCEVSLLFTVDGAPGPMRSYPERATADPAALGSWVSTEGAFPGGGMDSVYRPRECLALVGRATPHARLPQQDRAIIGALFYSGLT